MRPLVLFAVLLLATGCSYLPTKGAASVVSAQAPGVASGAGAEVVGPANSASPTTQTAERRVAYYPPPGREWPLPTSGVQPQPAPQPAPVDAPKDVTPAWSYEKVSTTIGQHQSAATIVKVAEQASGWSSVRWLGILALLVGIGGALWSYNNEHGYMLVFVKVAICGLILVIVGENPWLLLILLIPFGFYVIQKLGLLRLPVP